MTDYFVQTIESYAKSLETKMKIEKKSENTISAYMRTFRDFVEFSKNYHKELTLENLKEDDIYAFIKYKSQNLNKQGEISISTTNAIISHLKRLFKHIERNSDLNYDFDKVFMDIKIALPRREPKGLNLKRQNSDLKNDIDKILSYFEGLKNTIESFLPYRNSLLFKILVYGGLRASEAISLKFSDIEFVKRKDEKQTEVELAKLSFTGKGNKKRRTYIRKEIINDEYHTLLNDFRFQADWYIAKTSSGKTMDRTQLYRMLKTVYFESGVKASGVHILRHTFAKMLNEKGKNLITIKELLGHSSIQTTSIYLNPTEEMVLDEISDIM